MRAQVLEPPRSSDSGIRLGTSVGDLLGTWRGEQPVEVSDFIDVEIDVRAAHVFDELDFVSNPDEGFRIQQDDAVAVTGRVVEIDHQGVMSLEVGSALLSIEMEGVAPLEISGMLVTLVVRDLEVYPTAI